MCKSAANWKGNERRALKAGPQLGTEEGMGAWGRRSLGLCVSDRKGPFSALVLCNFLKPRPFDTVILTHGRETQAQLMAKVLTDGPGPAALRVPDPSPVPPSACPAPGLLCSCKGQPLDQTRNSEVCTQ